MFNRRRTQTVADFLIARPARLKGMSSRRRGIKNSIMSSLQEMHKFIKPLNPLGVSSLRLDERLIFLFNHASRVIAEFFAAQVARQKGLRPSAWVSR